MSDKTYSEGQIVVGTFLGGPLAGGYFLWRDFRGLEMDKHALIAAVGAVALTLVTIAAAFLLPDRSPNFLIPAIYVGLTYGITRAFLPPDLAERVPHYSWGNTILISLAFLAVMIAAIVSVEFGRSSIPHDTVTKHYGRMRHEVQFDSDSITELEVDRIADALTTAGFFDEELQKNVDVSKLDNRYVITIYCNETIREPGADEPFVELHENVQSLFPSNPITFDLAIGTPENIAQRIE